MKLPEYRKEGVFWPVVFSLCGRGGLRERSSSRRAERELLLNAMMLYKRSVSVVVIGTNQGHYRRGDEVVK